jgi:hypothetical protein
MRIFGSDAVGEAAEPVTTFRDDGGSWDIGDVAEIIGSTPSTYIDDILTDDNGNTATVEPERSRVRAGSVRIGGAAADTTTAVHLREAGQHHGAGVWYAEAYEARLPTDDSAAHDVLFFDTYLSWLRATPWASRPKLSKKLSLVVKPMFLLGDVAVIFNILNKSGSNALAAALTGVSAATGAVASGTVAGHNAAVAFQRQRRGPKPEDVPDGLSDLYSDPEPSTLSWTMWLIIAGVFAVILGFAVAMITLAGGYPRYEALGGGLITALTVVGSFGAEAYGTNTAADRIEEVETKRDAANTKRAEIGELRADADRELVLAETIRAAGSHQARAALNTAMVVSDPPKADERIRGYVAAERSEDLAMPPLSKVELTAPPSIDRSQAAIDRTVRPRSGAATIPAHRFDDRPEREQHAAEREDEVHRDAARAQETDPETVAPNGARARNGRGA